MRITRTRERAFWAVGLVAVTILSSGVAYAVASPGSYNCVKTERDSGFALDCSEVAPTSPTSSPSASPSASGTASPTSSPTTSPSPSGSTTSPPTSGPTGPAGPVGWPSPTTVGVPSGTLLTPYTGPCTITVPNTVIEAKTVNCGPLEIATTGVHIVRSVVDGGVVTGRSNATNQTVKVTVEDSRLIGRGSTRGIDGSAYKVLRSHLSGVNSAGWCWRECEVASSYLEAAGEHSSAFRLQRDGVIRDSVLWCRRGIADTDGGCSGDLVSYPDVIDGQQTVIDGNTVVGNLVKATPGWFCVRAGNGTGWVITGNTFERGAGSCSEQSGGAAVTNWSGGTWLDNRYTDGTTVEALR